jgi:PadR family transcriptional regulator AphA
MSLKHAILVLLEKEPGSGYDLVQRFKSGIGHFWNASHQQVYQELKKLHEDGLVTFEVEAQQDRPDRKVYRITRDGLRALRDWIREPVNPPRINNALLVKVYGARREHRSALLAELGEHLQKHRQRLDEYRELERFYFAADAQDRREHAAPYLTLRLGIRYEQHWIEWLEETCTLLADDRPPATPLLSDAPVARRPAPANAPQGKGRKSSRAHAVAGTTPGPESGRGRRTPRVRRS